MAADLLASAEIPVREVLELGSGGGHSAHYLAQRFAMTLVDLSPAMLAVSHTLNPGCAHQEGDMRSVRLGRTFDAVFVHDAIDDMTSLDDLCAAVATAVAHLMPSGVAVLMPDDLADTFAPSTEHGGADAADGRGARYLEWTWDPNPFDTWIQTEYLFVLRNADGGCANPSRDPPHRPLSPRDVVGRAHRRRALSAHRHRNDRQRPPGPRNLRGPSPVRLTAPRRGQRQ